MELRHLRYFAAVAEERHFGRAARRLHIAQPPLSRQIQALENELGFPLFVRSRRRVDLTPAGTVLLEHTRRVFEAVDLALHEARRASVGESGRVTVGYLSSLAYSGLTELLRAYRLKFPGVEVVLRELPPTVQMAGLRDGSIDVGFVRSPFDEPGLLAERVRREELLLAMPAGHPLAGSARIALKRLAREPFVLFPRSRSPAYYDQLIGMCRDAGFSPRVAQEAPHLDMLSLVMAGFGVAIVPESVRVLDRDGVVLRPLVGAPHTDLLIAWREGNTSPVLREFLAVVRAVGVRVKARREVARTERSST